MFDQETIQLLRALPSVPELSGESARTRLTQAYLELVRLRVSGITNTENLPQVLNEVQQMANGLELFCMIEFARQGQLLQSGRAAAFVAAQSLELLSELPQVETLSPRHILVHPQTVSLIESGLLYLIAGYYANASTISRKLPQVSGTIEDPASYNDLRQNVANNVLGLLGGLIGLNVNAAEQYNPAQPDTFMNGFSKAPADLSASAEAQLLSQIGLATAEYLSYLAGQRDTPEAAISRVANLVSMFSQVMEPDSLIQPPAESLLSYHLASLLEIVFRDLSGFATVHSVPPPADADEDYQSGVRQWLRAKARRKHALLWHSTKKWLDARHTKNAVHTVVSMPTGSGKSFLAELALVERLHKGWGLYLAPMNALVRQIQQDLERELPEIGVNKVHRFLTDEHTTLEEEVFTGAGTKEIVIMTPEKALLAIRLKPEAFKTCSVCIFDESHILAKEDRGAASDDFLSRLITHAPDVHIMLMSAMVQNPDNLAEWLHSATGKISHPILLNWKPTRSLRTLAAVPQDQLEGISDKGSQQCTIQLIGQASIAWRENGNSLFVNSSLPSMVKVKKQNGAIKWDDSINAAARQIGTALVQQNISTLIFLNSNATHVWTQGAKTPELNWQADQTLRTKSNQNDVSAWLQLAQAELGSLSPIGKLHQKGVTVHSGALIDEERRAAEMAYKYGLVGLMIATGTLAQGLNLPSQAVVMAGIKGSQFVGERTAADILNALGRSGRAGFHNIGLSILVPQHVLQYVDRSSIDKQADEYVQLLHKHDACLDVSSALKGKVDKLIAAAKSLDPENGKIHPNDLETATMILGSNTENDEAVLFKYSYAAYSANSEDYVVEGVNAAHKLVNFFLKSSPCPDWIPKLAQRSGLSIAWLTQMHRAIEETISLDQLLAQQADFKVTLRTLQEVMKEIHPVVMVDKFDGKPDGVGITQLQGLPKKLNGQDFDWSIDIDSPNFDPERWKNQWDDVFKLLVAWINGDSFKQIAVEFFELVLPRQSSFFPKELPRSDKSPLNRAIKSVKQISYPLRHISGGFILLATKMMIEENLIQGEEDIPLSVGMLPQAIHWGIDRLDKAFWYYNLLPARCVAHACSEAFPIEYENDAQIKATVIQQAATIRANPDALLGNTSGSNITRDVLSAVAVLLR